MLNQILEGDLTVEKAVKLSDSQITEKLDIPWK